MRQLLIIILLTLLTPFFAMACEKCDIVIDVIDGDTVVIQCEGKARQVHLVSVDAPQLEQPYGKQAKAFTEKMVKNHVVTARYIDNSRVSDIVNANGQSLKWGLIRAGLAWYPDNHQEATLRNVSDKVGKFERKARRARKGLWAQDNPQPPWELHNGTEALSRVMTAMRNMRLGGIVG
ncbi:MAG: hypothetical protein C0615_01605 [Desulfuromonas sp.]|nr:MAG: hypothetical protein C0615_01605 [Desulfuromonas sp.]